MTGSSFSLLVCLVILTGFSSCGQDHTNDDTSKPADGGTDGGVAMACEDALRQSQIELEQTKRERDGYKADLDECVAKIPEGEPK